MPKRKRSASVKRKRGRPRKGEEHPKDVKRLEHQRTMSLEEIVGDLPKDFTVGSKHNAKGSKPSWTGHKLHLDVADGSVPISCLIMSASVHDRQVGIPLATMAQQRVAHCYDLMDSAYDAKRIYAHSSALGHVPIIDPNPRNRKAEYGLEQKAHRSASRGIHQRSVYSIFDGRTGLWISQRRVWGTSCSGAWISESGAHLCSPCPCSPWINCYGWSNKPDPCLHVEFRHAELQVPRDRCGKCAQILNKIYSIDASLVANHRQILG